LAAKCGENCLTVLVTFSLNVTAKLHQKHSIHNLFSTSINETFRHKDTNLSLRKTRLKPVNRAAIIESGLLMNPTASIQQQQSL
jgi:hypothetical protein